MLREEFARDLHRTYVIKRGEPVPETGCSIVEAAEALAAVYPDASLAAFAKRSLDKLWDGPEYSQVFGAQPNVFRVWRSVQLMRTVRSCLADLRDRLAGRALAVATYGDLLITHVVFRSLDTSAIDDEAADATWEEQLARVSELAEGTVSWILQAIDAELPDTSHVYPALHNGERIEKVARRVIRSMAGGSPAPALLTEYQVTESQQQRQKDAVLTIIAAKRIPDGTLLEFRPVSRPERREMAEWLRDSPDRGAAVWRNSAKGQLQWKYDGHWYSPSGLVKKMRILASGREQQAQGTRHWHVPGEGSLIDIAANIRAEQDFEPDSEPGS
jgi:hypothetical protein